jgi:hypothetical protein
MLCYDHVVTCFDHKVVVSSFGKLCVVMPTASLNPIFSHFQHRMQAFQIVAAFFEASSWGDAFVLHLSPEGDVGSWPESLQQGMENLVWLEVDSGHSLPAFGVDMPRLKVLRLSNCASPSSLEVRGCSWALGH